MHKYLRLFSLSWQNGLVYRTSFILWRTRQFLSSFMSLSLWSVIFSNTDAAFGYTSSEMLTYVFLASILQSIILDTALHQLPSRVYSGEITVQLLKPVSLLGYLATEDIADKARNFAFILIESVLLFCIFEPQLPSVPSLLFIFLFVIATVLGASMHFFIELLFGSLGFWTPDTWGPKILLFTIIECTSGKLFPLNVLPQVAQNLLFYTPFPYFSFVQTQIFLQKLTFLDSVQAVGVLLIWTVSLAVIAKWVWQRGMKDYSAAGL